MRWFIRIVIIVLMGLMAFTYLGPLAPEGTVVREWSLAIREAIPAFFGYPLPANG